MMIWAGSVSALISGALLPLFALYLADMIDVFSKFDVLKQSSSQPFTLEDLTSDVNRIAVTFLVLALVALGSNFV